MLAEAPTISGEGKLMQMQTGTRRGTLGVAAGVVAGLAAGFALGAVVGWPSAEDEGARDDAVARMCTALDDVDDESWRRVEEDGLSLSSGEDRMMVASLMAAVGYAEAAAMTEQGNDQLRATAGDLRTALEQLKFDVARDHAGTLREHC